MIIDVGKKIKVIRPEARSIFPYSNSLYIDDEIRAVIDAGAGGRAYADIPSASVELLLLSHNHFDHVNGVSFFNHAAILAGQEEIDGYKDPQTYYLYSGFQHWEQLMGRARLGNFFDAKMPGDIPSTPGFQYIDLDGVIKDGDIFDLGQTKLAAIHTPGHSHGHYAFFCEKEGILFSGDLDISPRGPWYGCEVSNLDDLIESTYKIIDLEPRILVTSHRRVFDSRKDDIKNLLVKYLDICLEKEEKILQYLNEPRDLDDIAGQDFVYEFPDRTPYIIFWAKMMILKHLRRLEKAGKISKVDEKHYLRA